MIKRTFWESVAEIWCRKEEIVTPEIDEIPDISEDTMEFNTDFDMDDLLGDIFGDGTTFEDILPKK